MEPVKYYERNDTVNTLSQLGINITPLTEAERAAQTPKVEIPAPVVTPVTGSTQISGNQFTSIPNTNQNPYAGQTVNPQQINPYMQNTVNTTPVNQTVNQQANPYAGQAGQTQPDFNTNIAATFPTFAASQQTGNIKPAVPGIQPVINQ